MRLIDADALKKEIADLVVGGEEGIAQGGDGNYWLDGIHSAYREIENAPTVEPKKGKWINFNSYFRKCSLCQKVVGFDYIEQNGETFNFCPNCGADMRGDKDDQL